MADDDLIEPPFIARYRKCFQSTWSDETPIDEVRFVVLDSETTDLILAQIASLLLELSPFKTERSCSKIF
jgi:hypothetical protein